MGKSSTEDSRRGMGSPKPKSRGECGFDHFLAIAAVVRMFMAECTNEVVYPENAKDTLCRNVTIYGRCRYEDKGARIPWSTVHIGSYGYNLTFAYAVSRLRFQSRSTKTEPREQLRQVGIPSQLVSSDDS